MTKYATLAIALATVLALSTAVSAGVPQPGDIGIFFDDAGTQTSRAGVGAFSFFDVFVVAFDVPGGLLGYEFALQVPAGTIVSGGRQFFPAGALDVGTGDDNWLVGTGGTCLSSNGHQVLVKYTSMLFLAQPNPDQTLCMGPATPTSFPPGAPGYLTCLTAGDLRRFGSAYRGCAVINPAVITPPVPDAVSSFGALKAQYKQ
jgi:hypothetical protein